MTLPLELPDFAVGKERERRNEALGQKRDRACNPSLVRAPVRLIPRTFRNYPRYTQRNHRPHWSVSLEKAVLGTGGESHRPGQTTAETLSDEVTLDRAIKACLPSPRIESLLAWHGFINA